MDAREARKVALDALIKNRLEELARYRNFEAILQADIESFEKQKADIDKELEAERVNNVS